ncbi:MAG: sulfotransferase family 2 domain-containing protein, partial [Gammaproteobacteria bacterium]
IHVPKNAGTSIRASLKKAYGPDWVDFEGIDKALRKERHPAYANHYPYWYMQKMLLKGHRVIEPLQDCTKAMVVRNPWERMVSLYFHRMKKLYWAVDGKPRNDLESIACAEKGFTSWLLNTPHPGDHILTRKSQVSWGKGISQEFVIDHVLRQENIAKDFENLCNLKGIPHHTLGHILKGGGQSRDYRKHYSEVAIWHVDHYFKEDIERWGYEF